MSIQAASVLVAGRLGPDDLSAASVSVMLAFVTGFVVALGGWRGLSSDSIGLTRVKQERRPWTHWAAPLSQAEIDRLTFRYTFNDV